MTGRRPAGGGLRLGVLLAAAALATLAHARMNTSSAARSGRLHVPDPARAKLFSLGFEPVVADYYWVQALQIVGEDTGVVEAHADQVADAVELVTTLDPWVDHPYRFAAVWLTFSIEQVRRADRMLVQGIAYHPLDWRNRFYLGYNQFFYLENDARAADVLETAVGMPGAPRYLGAFVTRLRAQSSGLDTAVLFLQELIRSTDDEYARAEYLKAWDEIETERRARRLDAARAEFWKRTGRDIRTPAELWSGPHAVLSTMPPAHPHFEGFGWILDPHTHEIVSSFYGTRYELHIHPADEKRRKLWHRQLGVEPGAERGDG